MAATLRQSARLAALATRVLPQPLQRLLIEVTLRGRKKGIAGTVAAVADDAVVTTTESEVEVAERANTTTTDPPETRGEGRPWVLASCERAREAEIRSLLPASALPTKGHTTRSPVRKDRRGSSLLAPMRRQS